MDPGGRLSSGADRDYERAFYHLRTRIAGSTASKLIERVMPPPFWLDEHGQRVPTRQCPKCAREWPVYRHRLPHLIMAGWKPMKPMLVVNWCGHGQEVLPVPEAEGYWQLVPIMGEAA